MTATALIAALSAFLHLAGAASSPLAIALREIAAEQLKRIVLDPAGDLAQAESVLNTIQELYERFADQQS